MSPTEKYHELVTSYYVSAVSNFCIILVCSYFTHLNFWFPVGGVLGLACLLIARKRLNDLERNKGLLFLLQMKYDFSERLNDHFGERDERRNGHGQEEQSGCGASR